MLCKAIIESKLSKYKFKVRIPSLHKSVESIGATPTQNIPMAIASISAGVYPALKVNDVVLVGFEDDDIDKPVIVGLLFNENAYNVGSDIHVDSLEVKVNTILPEETQIGKVTSTNIKFLEGLNNNVQLQLETANNRIDDIYRNGCGELMLLLNKLDSDLQVWLNEKGVV